MNDSSSFWQSAWKRPKKNKGAMAGLIMIILAILVAIFSYVIAPDQTHYANRSILEIVGEKPGFKQNFLLVKKPQQRPGNFLKEVFTGKYDHYDFIPVVSTQDKGDSIYARKFID